jgi:hypothetical protein
MSMIEYNMAPVCKYASSTVLSLRRYWTGKQLFVVSKVTGNMNIVLLYGAQNI